MNTSFPLHVFIYHGCGETVHDSDSLMRVLEEAATELGCTTVGRLQTHYQPHGMTLVLMLAESHFLVTTWPEHRVLVAEALLCNGRDPYPLFLRLERFLGVSSIPVGQLGINLLASEDHRRER